MSFFFSSQQKKKKKKKKNPGGGGGERGKLQRNHQFLVNLNLPGLLLVLNLFLLRLGPLRIQGNDLRGEAQPFATALRVGPGETNAFFCEAVAPVFSFTFGYNSSFAPIGRIYGEIRVEREASLAFYDDEDQSWSYDDETESGQLAISSCAHAKRPKSTGGPLIAERRLQSGMVSNVLNVPIKEHIRPRIWHIVIISKSCMGNKSISVGKGAYCSRPRANLCRRARRELCRNCYPGAFFR